jgi:hypothetical protein
MSEHHPCLGAMELDRIAHRQTEKSPTSVTLALIAALAVSSGQKPESAISAVMLPDQIFDMMPKIDCLVPLSVLHSSALTEASSGHSTIKAEAIYDHANARRS